MKWPGRKRKPKTEARRRRAVRRSSHTVNFVIALALAAALSAGGWFGYPYLRDYLCTIPHFKVTRITFTGLDKVKESELRKLWPRVGGVNLFALNFPDLEKRLKQHPWVENARLRRHLPDKLFVDVVEREPVALLERNGLWALDVHGVTMPVSASCGELDLPLVKADSGISPQPGSSIDDKRLSALLPRLDALHHRAPNLWSAISEIAWDGQGQLEMYAFGNPACIHVGQAPTWQQMLNFYTFVVYQGKRKGLDDVASIDLRFDGQVVVRRSEAQTDSTVKTKS